MNSHNQKKYQDYMKTALNILNERPLFPPSDEEMEAITAMSTEEVNAQLIKMGKDPDIELPRKIISYIHLNPDIPFEISQDVKCRIPQYSEPIIIKNMIRMSLQDLGRYRICKSLKLADWVKAKLEMIIQELLFDARYIDLLLDFVSVERRIKQRLSAEAELIGYAINQLIAVPDLKPLMWLSSFSFNVEQSFKTKDSDKDSGAEVKLKIVGSARINDLRAVKHYLDPGQDIPQLIEESIREKVAEFSHRVELERFCMRFSFEDENKKSIEQEIIEIVKKIIADEFQAEVIQVMSKVVETEYITHLRELQKEIGEFIITIEDIETFTYKGLFRVEGVDANGWNKFRLLNSSIEKIQNYLQKSMQTAMKTWLSGIGVYKNFKQFKTMEKLIEKIAGEDIIDEFGLVIRISTASWVPTQLEEKSFPNLALAREMVSQESSLPFIHELEEKLRACIKAGEDEEEIAKLIKHIDKLRMALPTGQVAQKSKFQLYLSESSSNTNWKDLGIPKQLPTDERQSNEEEADK